MSKFGREGLQEDTGTYLCATCGEDTPGNGGINMCAVVSVLETDGRVRNLRFCYANGCAKKLLSGKKTDAVDEPVQLAEPTPTPPQGETVVPPDPTPDRSRPSPPPPDADASTDGRARA